MATYTFRAIDLAGVPAQGELDAGWKQAVTDELRQRGLIVLDIVEQKASVTSQDLLDRFKRIKSHELTVMTRQLATMVASGMSILRSFHVLEDQTENEKLKEILSQVRQDVEAGISLFAALEEYPDVLYQLHIAIGGPRETAAMVVESL